MGFNVNYVKITNKTGAKQMNKKQLIAQLSGSLNLSKADAERTFDTITNTILDALKGDDLSLIHI